MTECKYSHTVFYPETAWSGTNIACLKTCRHKEILVSLPNHVAGLSPSVRFFFFYMSACIPPPALPCIQYFTRPWPPPMKSSTCRPIKRPRVSGKQRPGHCPINQLVNVIKRMWDMAATGRMKHVDFLSRTVGFSGR